MNFDYLYYDAFATDLTTALTWAKENIDNERTGIWALSMGSIASVFTLQNQKANFLIGEGFVADPTLVKKRQATSNDPILLPRSHKQYDSVLESTKTPMLVFTGTEDTTTTLADAKSVVNQKPNRILITFEGKHLEGFWKLTNDRFGDEYVSHINSFIVGL